MYWIVKESEGLRIRVSVNGIREAHPEAIGPYWTRDEARDALRHWQDKNRN